MKNLKVSGNLQVNVDIINDKMDYQLDQPIRVNEQSSVFIHVDFSKYDYKLCMWLSARTTESQIHNTCLFLADNNTIRNSQCRWVYTGVVSWQGNVNPSVADYAYQTQSNGYVYLIDNENNANRYCRINAELYHIGGTTIDYQCNSSRTYAASFEYKNSAGLIYDEGYTTLPNQLCVWNGERTNNQYLNGQIRVYKRPKFRA